MGNAGDDLGDPMHVARLRLQVEDHSAGLLDPTEDRVHLLDGQSRCLHTPGRLLVGVGGEVVGFSRPYRVALDLSRDFLDQLRSAVDQLLLSIGSLEQIFNSRLNALVAIAHSARRLVQFLHRSAHAARAILHVIEEVVQCEDHRLHAIVEVVGLVANGRAWQVAKLDPIARSDLFRQVAQASEIPIECARQEEADAATGREGDEDGAGSGEVDSERANDRGQGQRRARDDQRSQHELVCQGNSHGSRIGSPAARLDATVARPDRPGGNATGPRFGHLRRPPRGSEVPPPAAQEFRRDTLNPRLLGRAPYFRHHHTHAT